MKSTINLTRRNMEHHKTEEWAQSLLTYSAQYMEVDLDWNFNSRCNTTNNNHTVYESKSPPYYLCSKCRKDMDEGILLVFLTLWDDPHSIEFLDIAAKSPCYLHRAK